MKVMDWPPGATFKANSDLDAKLVTRLRPCDAARDVTFTVPLTAPVVALTDCRMMSDDVPKLPSTEALFHTLPEQLLVVQKPLPATAVAPVLMGSAAPVLKEGSK